MNIKKIAASFVAAALLLGSTAYAAVADDSSISAQSDTYAITKGTAGSGGSFEIDKTEAAEGDTVTVTATHGQNIAVKIVVKTADNKPVTVTPA